MTLSLIATPGAADANSYTDLATAVSYAGYRIGGNAFAGLTSDQQIRALVTATWDIDTLENFPGFIGSRSSSAQALAFPREGESSLPVSLMRACVELAMSYAPSIATDDDVLNAETGIGRISEDTAGPITTRYFSPLVIVPGDTAATSIERFPPAVQRLLAALVHLPAGTLWGSASVNRAS